MLLITAFIGSSLMTKRPAIESIYYYTGVYDEVNITEYENDSFIIEPKDPAKEQSVGIVFYCGAQITPDAYVPLMAELAQKGYCCWIPKMTCNMASLSHNAAQKIIDSNPLVETWILAGHSMGGLTASGFADDHIDEVDGLILLAAYSNRDLSKYDLPVLSIYGDCDTVMNYENYQERIEWLPDGFEELIISGANHAQYGDYGDQPRDSAAAISKAEQRSITVNCIDEGIQKS